MSSPSCYGGVTGLVSLVSAGGLGPFASPSAADCMRSGPTVTGVPRSSTSARLLDSTSLMVAAYGQHQPSDRPAARVSPAQSSGPPMRADHQGLPGVQSTTNSAMQTVATTSRGSTLGMGGLGAGPSPPTHRSRAPAAVAASDKPSMASAKPKCTAVTPSRPRDRRHPHARPSRRRPVVIDLLGDRAEHRHGREPHLPRHALTRPAPGASPARCHACARCRDGG